MVLQFKDVKQFLRLRDSTIELVPHYAENATFDGVSVRLMGGDDVRMVSLRRTIEATADSILAQVSDLRGRSS